MEGELVKAPEGAFLIVPLKLFTYKYIVDEDAKPIVEWLTLEEYGERKKRVQSHIDVLRKFAKSINNEKIED